MCSNINMIALLLAEPHCFEHLCLYGIMMQIRLLLDKGRWGFHYWICWSSSKEGKYSSWMDAHRCASHTIILLKQVSPQFSENVNRLTSKACWQFNDDGRAYQKRIYHFFYWAWLCGEISSRWDRNGYYLRWIVSAASGWR